MTNNVLTASIALGQSLSADVLIGVRRLLAIQVPASIDGTAFTFQSSRDKTTWANMYDDAGNEVSVTMAASRYIPVDPATFASCQYLRVRTGTSGAATDQAAAVEVYLITAPVLGNE